MGERPELEILCATMHQRDFSKLREMNVRCDILFANQADYTDYAETRFSDFRARMFTTEERGVGKNRNLALDHAEGDILLFADDDLLYEDDVRERVLAAFDDLPDADVILFGNRYARGGEVYRTRCPRTERLRLYRALRYGTYVIAIRREALRRARLRFTELFGGGCLYSLGEDTDFILQCFRRGLRLYTYHYILGTTKKDSSTCFSGYNEKYFYDRGAFGRHAFRYLAPAYLVYVAVKFGRRSGLPASVCLKHLIDGCRYYPKRRSYEAYRRLRRQDSTGCP